MNLGFFGGGSTSGSSASSCGTGSDSTSDVGDQLSNVNVLEGASEKTWPEGLAVNLGGLKIDDNIIASYKQKSFQRHVSSSTCQIKRNNMRMLILFKILRYTLVNFKK